MTETVPKATGWPRNSPPGAFPAGSPCTTCVRCPQTLDELRALKKDAIKKDMESQALKEELRTLRRKLADQETELNKLKKRKRKKEAPAKQP